MEGVNITLRSSKNSVKLKELNMRCPTKRLQSVTPEEAWTGDKPTVNHLRIFGSLSYRHIPDERRRKLDDKSEALILIGYHPTGAYKLYSPLKQQVMKLQPGSGKISLKFLTHILEDSPRTKDVNPASSIQPPVRRSQRTRFPSTRLADYELYSNSSISDDVQMLKSDGSIAKHKARLVAKGFLQKQGIDYTEYAPVARMETIRLVIVVASSRNWTICQLDVKSAFLNGPLEEEIYILQPPGFEIKGKECKHKNLLFVCMYVDDLIITGDVNEEIKQFKEKMKSEFDMTNLGILHYFLGFEFMHTQKGIFLHQRKYTGEVLKHFNMENCNTASVPVMPNLKLTKELDEKPVDATLFKQIIGSLRFLCNSRPDISYGVGLLSRFMDNPRAPHMTAAKHILRYLKGTSDFGLLFPTGNDQNRSCIEAYSDSDWCGDKVERKSTYVYLFKYPGCTNILVALSSCEAEYIGSTQAACQNLWLEALLEEIKL
ncbi:hypothetical protein CR513_14284, partial [Mucuna pruriens]